MKKLAGFSLFVFFCGITALLTAGLVLYENKNNSSANNSGTNNNSILLSNLASSGVTVLDAKEVAKHNTNADCWIIVNNKVYNISNYASSHPGGARNILDYCGKESTQAFDTKGGQGSPHSASANQMLAQFYLGDLNQSIGQATLQQNIQNAQNIPIPRSRGEDDD